MTEEIMDIMDDSNNLNSKDDAVKFLSFVSDDLIFGVNAGYVTEIITNYFITMLPMVPGYIKGIINLRGQIIPIIDIRMRMNKSPFEYNDTSCIIVLNINTISVGILVDTVSQVVDVDEKKVSAMPANNRQELVSGMVSLSEDVVMLMLDCEQLVSN